MANEQPKVVDVHTFRREHHLHALEQSAMHLSKRRRQRLRIFVFVFLSILVLYRRHVRAGVHLAAMPILFKLGHVSNPLTLEADDFDVSFRQYSTKPDQGGNDTSYAVPALVHNVFIGSNTTLRPAWEEARRSCRSQHPGFAFEFWDEERANAFIQQQFPSVWPTWRNYRYPIQKADSLRYMLLYHYGGIFMDMDLYCVRPLTPLRRFDFVAAAAYPSGVSNGFLMSKPRLPFMAQVIQSLKAYDLSWFNLPYVTVSFSTGCHYLSTMYASSTTSRQRADLRILQGPPSNPRMHHLNGNATTPLFRHLGSSSWHSWDAAAFKTFKKKHAGFWTFWGFGGGGVSGKCTAVGLLVLMSLLIVLLLLAVGIFRRLLVSVCGDGGETTRVGWLTWRLGGSRTARRESRKREADDDDQELKISKTGPGPGLV